MGRPVLNPGSNLGLDYSVATRCWLSLETSLALLRLQLLNAISDVLCAWRHFGTFCVLVHFIPTSRFTHETLGLERAMSNSPGPKVANGGLGFELRQRQAKTYLATPNHHAIQTTPRQEVEAKW